MSARTLRNVLIGLVLVTGASVAVADEPRVPPEAEPGAEVGAAPAGEGGEHAEGHEDPTKYFNFFDLGYRHKDKLGGQLGDGMLGNMPMPAGEEEEPMSPPFVLMLVNFGLLLVLLGKYGAPAARKMAETRSNQIKSALDEAASLRKAAQDKLAEYSGKLASAQAEMDAMLTAMRADAEAEKQRILAAAEAQAAAVKRDADLRIAAEIQRARVELAREVALAAAGATEKILRERTTPADHTKLVDTFVSGMSTTPTSQGAV